MDFARSAGIVAALLARRPLVLALATAIATGALVCLVMLGGSLIIAVLVCIAGIYLLAKSPSAFALLAWMLFALVPEASGDIEFSSGLSGLTYRSIAGPLDLADMAAGLGVLALLTVRPSTPIEFYRRHRRLVTAYAVFLGVVALSIAANGLVLRPTALKPLVYMPVAAIWGYGLATSPRVATWIPPVLFVSAGISASLGLLNALGGTGVEFAGLHLAFKDRASVFLIVAALLVLLQDVLRRGTLLRGGRTWLWAAYGILCAGAIALSLRRSMWMNLGVGIAFSLLIAARSNLRRTLTVMAGVGAILGLTTLGILARTGTLGTLASHAASLVNTLQGHGTETSIADRLYEEVDAFRTARKTPILGGGPAARYEPSFGYMPSLDTSYVHNNYLWLFLHYGLVGLFAYLFFLWQLLRALARAGPGEHHQSLGQAVRLGVLASLVGLLPALAADSYLTAPHRWPLIVGFLVGAALGLGLAGRDTLDTEVGG
jgi:hypothetical protein